MKNEKQNLLTLQWENLTIAQLVYVQAVVMDEIEEVLARHGRALLELGDVSCLSV